MVGFRWNCYGGITVGLVELRCEVSVELILLWWDNTGISVGLVELWCSFGWISGGCGVFC